MVTKTETGAPTTKVMAGSVGAAIATLVIWGIESSGLTVDQGVKVAITTLMTFLLGYYMSPAPRDGVTQ